MQARTKSGVDLSSFDATLHNPGAPALKRTLWYAVNALIFDSWYCPSYQLKRKILSLFGGKTGRNIVIKPRVNIKYPWKLSIGDHTWIGEGVWIDNIECADIGAHCCISQGVYLCTGNHDWSDPAFQLTAKAITIADHAWVGAFAFIGPGVEVAEGTVVSAGSVVTTTTLPWTIYAGNPAKPVKERVLTAPVPCTTGAELAS